MEWKIQSSHSRLTWKMALSVSPKQSDSFNRPSRDGPKLILDYKLCKKILFKIIVVKVIKIKLSYLKDKIKY